MRATTIWVVFTLFIVIYQASALPLASHKQEAEEVKTPEVQKQEDKEVKEQDKEQDDDDKKEADQESDDSESDASGDDEDQENEDVDSDNNDEDGSASADKPTNDDDSKERNQRSAEESGEAPTKALATKKKTNAGKRCLKRCCLKKRSDKKGEPCCNCCGGFGCPQAIDCCGCGCCPNIVFPVNFGVDCDCCCKGKKGKKGKKPECSCCCNWPCCCTVKEMPKFKFKPCKAKPCCCCPGCGCKRGGNKRCRCRFFCNCSSPMMIIPLVDPSAIMGSIEHNKALGYTAHAHKSIKSIHSGHKSRQKIGHL